MKRTIILLLLSIPITVVAQKGKPAEKRDEAGKTIQAANKPADDLIYTPHTMARLKQLSDSLHSKYNASEFTGEFHSRYQARGIYIYASKGKAKQIKKDLENGISIDAFRQKYSGVVPEKVLILKEKAQDNEGKENVRFFSFPSSSSIYEADTNVYEKPLKGKWIWSYTAPGKYAIESLLAFYFEEEFKSAPIPQAYGRIIHYSESLIGTSEGIFRENASRSRQVYFDEDTTGDVAKFFAFLHTEAGRPEYKKETYDQDSYREFYQKYMHWDSIRMSYIDEHLKGNTTFSTLLQAALKYAMSNGGSGDEFEEYIERYLSADSALELKRRRIVRGMCGMDRSPYYHALNIARLAAETANPNVFVRAHLNVINMHNYGRKFGEDVDDGRNTNVKELEQIGINSIDLLLGIMLRIENAPQHHYYGYATQLGKTLAECSGPDRVEEFLSSMIQDTLLDDYNRVTAYYTYRSYSSNLQKDARRKEANLAKLGYLREALPAYLQKGLNQEYGLY